MAAFLAAVFGLSACIDKGPPPMEQQLREAGLPLDTVMTVDDRTQVMVRLNDGAPELMIFTPHSFGGSAMNAWTGDRPTVNGGQVGDAFSLGEWDDAEQAYGPGWDYLFGAGQGPIGKVVVDEPHARVEIVNPEVGGWVTVVPETIGIRSLSWKLVADDGSVLYQSGGLGLPATNVMAIDDETSVTVDVGYQKTELLVYTSNQFGGFDVRPWLADRTTVGDGMFGVASSVGPDGRSATGYRYLFGAGQGPIKSVAVDQPQARTAIFDPAFEAWVIAVPATIALDALEWQLLGMDGSAIIDATGIDPADP